MPSRGKNNRVWYYVAALGLLVLLYAFGLRAPFQRLASLAFDPALTRLQSLGVWVREVYRDQTARRDRAAALSALQDEVARLTAANAELQRVAEENAVLRDHLSYRTEESPRSVLAKVIARGDPLAVAGPTETVMIDRGSRDGLKTGAPALSETGVLVGLVSAVQDSTAQIRLTNHRDCKVAATVLGAEGVNGITEGERGLTVALRFIPQTAAIKAGDLVVTAGIEEYIPRGLAIGKVTAVRRESNDIWQSATIQPLVDPDRLLIVSVLY